MREELIEKYKRYAESPEAFAVLFVKKYLRAAAGKWVDIIDFEEGEFNNIWKLEFKSVRCELFPRKIRPKYPPKKNFYDEESYIIACRAITWEAAHRDIAQQRAEKIAGITFLLRGDRIKVDTIKTSGGAGNDRLYEKDNYIYKFKYVQHIKRNSLNKKILEE